MQNALTAITLIVSLTGLSAAPRDLPAALDQPAALQAPMAVPVPFTSNGCSGFREARFFSCCFVHDFAFWAGGTWKDRTAADRDLRHCLYDVSHDWFITGIGYVLVRLGTIPGALVNDGWGRGWINIKRRRWAPLTPDQQRQVADERRRVCGTLALNPATGKYRVDEKREIRPNQARQFCGADLPSLVPDK